MPAPPFTAHLCHRVLLTSSAAVASVLVLVLVLALGLGGCAGTFEPLPATAQERVSATAFRNATLQGTTFDASWWRRFGDPALSALIERALAANLDIRLAALRVEEARAGTRGARSRQTPTLALNASASDQRSGLPDAAKLNSPDVRAYRASVDLSWELDVFGAARAGADAALLDAEAAAHGVDAARLLVSSEVARQYFIHTDARARLQRVQALLQVQTDTERLSRSREAAGEASRFEVSQASGDTAALAAQLPPLRALIATTEHQLAVLLGLPATAGVEGLATAAPARWPGLPPLAAGQPVQLLSRRPDLRAAERQLAAASARLRESRADLLPKFFLAALFGGQDLRVNAFDLSPARYSSVALAFSMPIFNAGRLQAAALRQSARERSAALAYEQRVLDAVQEVESSLVALNEERVRNAALEQAWQQRSTGVRHAQSLYREGQISLLPLLDAQRSLIASELAVQGSHTQLQLDAVQLFKAMGGGWHSLPEPTRPPADTTGASPANTPAP